MQPMLCRKVGEAGNCCQVDNPDILLADPGSLLCIAANYKPCCALLKDPALVADYVILPELHWLLTMLYSCLLTGYLVDRTHRKISEMLKIAGPIVAEHIPTPAGEWRSSDPAEYMILQCCRTIGLSCACKLSCVHTTQYTQCSDLCLSLIHI